MKLSKVDLSQTHQFSSLFLDYLQGARQLDSFYGERPTAGHFKKQIAAKDFPIENRKLLVKTLKQQYTSLSLADKERDNMEVLADPNTFTITTGHQLNIFTGPLYFIYKIVTVINTCKALKKEYPEQNFVPVYWMATEDHDFEEISYFRLNGKKYKWETNQKGAVGRFSPTGIEDIIGNMPGVPEIFKKAYNENDNLADAVRSYVHDLFGEYGLLVVDADNPELKSQLKRVIMDDLYDHTAKSLTEKQSERLDGLGYKTQVFPRNINFFYLDKDLRSRLVKEEGKFSVLDSDLQFSEKEINNLIEEYPERFSPNVILRPLYQEMVLPNLAYVGGPSEVTYWLQLKPLFDHYKVPFPIVMPRNFAMIIPKNIKGKMEKAAVRIEDIFVNRDELLGRLVNKYTSRDIHLNGQKKAIVELYDLIRKQALTIDPTLQQHVEAQQTKVKNSLENIEKKFIRAEKKNQKDRIRQVEAIFNYLWPQSNLQERTDNFLNFYQENPSFINELITYFEPFDFRFNILIDG